MKLRYLAALAPGLALGLGAACDRFYFVSARLPLIAPVDSACLRSMIDDAAPRRKVMRTARKGADQGPYLVAYVARGGAWSNVGQVVQGDSSVYLETGYARINRGFVRDEQDSIGSALGTFLVSARESCGGESPHAAKGLTVRGTDPSYEAWLVPGTNARVALRWSIDHYRLQVDTLAEHPNPRYPPWVPAAFVKIPRPPKGHSIATACARGDSAPGGGVVAVVRATNAAMYTEIRQAWDLDITGLRFVPGPTNDVRCENPEWSVPVRTARRQAQTAARTFTPSPGKARIYVYGPASRHVGGWYRSLKVEIDSQLVGWINASTYLMVDVEPGLHRVSSRAENESAVTLETVADSAYFVKLWPKLGILKTRSGMRSMDPKEARAAIVAARLVRTTSPGTPAH